MKSVDQAVVESIFATMQEMERLRTLTNRELVIEYLRFGDEETITDEMCTRLYPGWDGITDRELAGN